MPMTLVILSIHFGATAALWRELCQALDLKPKTAAVYAVALLIWWGTLLVLGAEIGAALERNAI